MSGTAPNAKPENADCPIDSIDAFLKDELPDSANESLLKHIDHCPDCRRRVTRAAGSDDDWMMIGEALADADSNMSSGQSGASRTGVGSNDIAALLTLLAPTDDPRAAGRIGPFEVVGVIGSGGMGIVIKAREPSLDRFVAIKLLAPHLASSQSARQRFAREARAAAAVIHDNVIPIYQVAHWNDLPYLVMPYHPEPTLAERITADGPLDIERTLSIALQIARGLSAAHSQGLVHRDVKPANVLLSKGTERAVITDFGLARATDDASLTRAGMLTGTPHYMSPEQANGKPVDQRSDLFSLGSVIFTMLTGHPPISNELGSETIALIAESPMPTLRDQLPSAPDWLSRLVAWLHQTNPVRRPESAEQVASIIQQCLAHQRQPGKNELPPQLTTRSSPMRGTVLACLVVAAVLIAAITANHFLPADPKEPTSLSQTNSNWSELTETISAATEDTKRIESEFSELWK